MLKLSYILISTIFYAIIFLTLFTFIHFGILFVDGIERKGE